jgi:hypothetical protein
VPCPDFLAGLGDSPGWVSIAKKPVIDFKTAETPCPDFIAGLGDSAGSFPESKKPGASALRLDNTLKITSKHYDRI